MNSATIQHRSQKRFGFSKAALLLVAAGLVLPGCGTIGNALGVTKSSPDEFAIVTKAPLVVPPDFALRPPRPGAPRPQERDPADQAAVSLFGETAANPVEGAPTPGERALLVKAGADASNSVIRAVLEEEYVTEKDLDDTIANKILFWRDTDEEPDGKMLNTAAENERIRREQAVGSAEVDEAPQTSDTE